MVKRYEVACFFGVETADVDRWISDGLSATKLPIKQRRSLRIYLPDLHRWLKQAGMFSEGLQDYAEFLAAFQAFSESRKNQKSA